MTGRQALVLAAIVLPWVWELVAFCVQGGRERAWLRGKCSEVYEGMTLGWRVWRRMLRRYVACCALAGAVAMASWPLKGDPLAPFLAFPALILLLIAYIQATDQRYCLATAAAVLQDRLFLRLEMSGGHLLRPEDIDAVEIYPWPRWGGWWVHWPVLGEIRLARTSAGRRRRVFLPQARVRFDPLMHHLAENTLGTTLLRPVPLPDEFCRLAADLSRLREPP